MILCQKCVDNININEDHFTTHTQPNVDYSTLLQHKKSMHHIKLKSGIVKNAVVGIFTFALAMS